MATYEKKCDLTGAGYYLSNSSPHADQIVDQPGQYTKHIYLLSYSDVATSSKEVPGFIEFHTPSFIGVPEAVKFTLCVRHSSSQTLRCGIVTSLENIAVYKEHSLEEISDAQDEHRISSTIIKTPYQETPTFSPEDNPPKNLSYEMSVDSLEPNTTYYLIFWAERTLNLNDSGYLKHVYLVLESLESCSISVVCRVGLINIDNGSGFSAYQGYIDDGASWYPVSPYVDNGSGWDTYS